MYMHTHTHNTQHANVNVFVDTSTLLFSLSLGVHIKHVVSCPCPGIVMLHTSLSLTFVTSHWGLQITWRLAMRSTQTLSSTSVAEKGWFGGPSAKFSWLVCSWCVFQGKVDLILRVCHLQPQCSRSRSLLQIFLGWQCRRAWRGCVCGRKTHRRMLLRRQSFS